MKVIGFAGLPGSGKSTVIEAIEDLGEVVTMGDVIRNEAKKRKIEPTDENLGKIAKEIREIGGQGIVAEKCVEFINELASEIVIIDGIRSMDEVKIFRKYWKLPIVAIILDEDLRFKRLSERGRSDDPKSLEDLKERDKREINFGVNEVIEKSNYKFINDKPIKVAKQEAKKLILEIINTF
jgi:dephospho-CoA kinase